MNEMLESGFGADVLVKLSPSEMSLSVHSSVLGNACPYFKGLFSENPRRPDSTFIVTELADFDARAVAILLVDMYGLRSDPENRYRPAKEEFNLIVGRDLLGSLYDVGILIGRPLPAYVRFVDEEADVFIMPTGSGLHIQPKEGDSQSYSTPIDVARDRKIVVDYVINSYTATLHTRVLSADGVAALNAWLGRDVITSIKLIDTDQWDTSCGDYTYKQHRVDINGRMVWLGKLAQHFSSKGISVARIVGAFLAETVVHDEFV